MLRRFPYDIIFVSHHNSITVLALLTTRDAQGIGEIVLSVSARNKRRKKRASGERRSESSRTVIFHSIRVNQQWRLIFRWDGERGEAAGIYLDDHSDR